MQASGNQWQVTERRAASHGATKSVPLALNRSLNIPPLNALYETTQFVRCSTDGKDVSVATLKLDSCGRFLRISSSEEENLVDVRKLRVSGEHELLPSAGNGR